MTAKEDRSSELLAEHSFACSACGKLAGSVQLLTREEGLEVIVTSFTSELTARVKPKGLKRLRKIISLGDARALHRFDFEFAPFFCPRCKASYCGDHWMRRDVFDEDGWHDSIRGRCPAGHERMLED